MHVPVFMFAAKTGYGIPWGSLKIQDAYQVFLAPRIKDLSSIKTLADALNAVIPKIPTIPEGSVGMYEKWEAVKSHLVSASTGVGGQMFANYLSGSTGLYPFTVVSGHILAGTSAERIEFPAKKDDYPDYWREWCSSITGLCAVLYEGTNILVTEWLMKQTKKARVGLIYTDFPGAGLINQIIAQNSFSCGQ